MKDVAPAEAGRCPIELPFAKDAKDQPAVASGELKLSEKTLSFPRFRITHSRVLTHGPTDKCHACFLQYNHQELYDNEPHTPECRARFAELLKLANYTVTLGEEIKGPRPMSPYFKEYIEVGEGEAVGGRPPAELEDEEHPRLDSDFLDDDLLGLLQSSEDEGQVPLDRPDVIPAEPLAVAATRGSYKAAAREAYRYPLPGEQVMPESLVSRHGELLVYRISERAYLPTRASVNAAGLDLFAYKDAQIKAHGHTVVGTGLIVSLPPGTYGRVASRTGMALKHALGVNSTVVDADYRGELKVVLVNLRCGNYTVRRGDRIAQLILESCLTRQPREVGDRSLLDAATRGSYRTPGPQVPVAMASTPEQLRKVVSPWSVNTGLPCFVRKKISGSIFRKKPSTPMSA